MDGIEFSMQRVEGIDLTTGIDQPGTAHFPRLEFGIYVVSETDASPHEIDKPIEPFLVSGPMADGNFWL